MSLTDLKKSAGDKPNKKKFTIDEFIDDAENYAKGSPEIVSAESGSVTEGAELSLAQAITLAKQHQKQKQDHKKPIEGENKRFRHSTFTLSEEAIEQLQALAKETNLAKSHIIRILIDELCNQEQHDKLTKLLNSNVP